MLDNDHFDWGGHCKVDRVSLSWRDTIESV